jgi:uncharacterized membrane protein
LLLLFVLLLLGAGFLFYRLRAIAQKLEAVDRRLRLLEARGNGQAAPAVAAVASSPPGAASPVALAETVTAAGEPPPVATAASVDAATPLQGASTSAPTVAATAPAAAGAEWRASRSADELETTIGSRWMLVVGTVILVLGVGFFVKYAFDNHWINETTRIAVSTMVGVVLWLGGLRLIDAGYHTYGHVIAGGGLAIVYISAYAAHALYGMVSAGVAFAWMVAVSGATATTAHRRRSLGLALTAIVLAYVAPLLIGRDGGHLAFFAYILTLAVVTWLLSQRHDWPALGLSALYLTVATTVMWASGSFSSDIYASTEIYLTAALVLFVAILRAHRSSIHPVARASALALVALVAIYHVASLIVLYPHSVPYLGYLILGTTVTAAMPAIRNSPRLRLAVWAAISAPFYAWLINHTSSSWYAAAMATAAGIYLLHLLTQFLTMSETNRPSNAEIALFHANGLSLFAFTYIAVDANAGSTALLASSLAMWNGALAWACRGRIAEGTAQALALAFTLAATAIALAFVGPWITVGWAAEGGAIIWIGLVTNRRLFRQGGAMLLALATVRLVLFQFPVTIASHRPIINSRVGAAAFIVALLYGVAALYRRYASTQLRETRVAITTATVAANALTVLLLTAEIRSYWELRERRLTVDFARLLSVSLAWAGYAAGLILLGFRRRSSTLRYMALALFGLTVAKMFAIDLLAIEGVYRIVGFIALGVTLLGASFLYQRSVATR